MPTKKIVCLANSFKPGGHCVAGLEIVNGNLGGWIRPVSNRPGGSINLRERTYPNGTECALLDVMEIDFAAHVPYGHQTENWEISAQTRWQKVGNLPAPHLVLALHNGHMPLWPYTQSTSGGVNDRITQANLAQLTSSLALVRPAQCRINVAPNPFKDDKLDVRAIFDWGGQKNNLKVTDPIMATHYQNQGAGIYHIDNPFLCVSVGDVFQARNEAYKLVAGIVP